MSKTAFLFPGTGSQYAGMFRKDHAEYAEARRTFEEASDALQFDMAAFCFGDGLKGDAPLAKVQAALFVCSVSAYRTYMQEVGVKPEYMAGHSLGEFAALACAGALEFRDALQIVWRRGQWMEESTPEGGGRIAAVKRLSPDRVKELLAAADKRGRIAEIACYNAPDQVVVAGHRDCMDEALSVLEREGAAVVPLQAKAPFHTPLMEPAAALLETELRNRVIRLPTCPVISNVTALPHAPDAESIAQRLTQQLTRPVQWERTVRYLQLQGVANAVEFGANAVLKKLNRRIARNMHAFAWDEPEDRRAIAEMRRFLPSFLDHCLAIAVSARNRNDDAESYRDNVAEPYKRLLMISRESEHRGGETTREQLSEARGLLERILEGKRIGPEKRDRLLAELLDQGQTAAEPLETAGMA